MAAYLKGPYRTTKVKAFVSQTWPEGARPSTICKATEGVSAWLCGGVTGVV